MENKQIYHTSYYDFDLPEERIAQSPLENRSESKMLVAHSKTETIEHRKFYDILEYLQAGDCLVLNKTRVLPARLYGVKDGTGAKIEVLLTKKHTDDQWDAMVKPGKRVKVGTVITFSEQLKAECIAILEDGQRHFKFHTVGDFYDVINTLGVMPLPPYIHEQLGDKERYQTVFNDEASIGSVAAPTAGLHFTEELLERVREKGVHIAYVTLHVGLGTFLPMSTEHVSEHKMHAETYFVDEENAVRINNAKQSGGRIIPVGTTSLRTIETIARDNDGRIIATSGDTDIFIYPGYPFYITDALITNFHLPKSTLIMLVSAFAGRDFVMKAYKEAIEKEYRFFSFGDAMFIQR
ncbi:MAG: tRNA preQ1(34) S-adenosylmethionine ribosyltransferase-isomerase QueA [Culicoidibacterales bacterium]